jgi:hypothetical protein
VEIVEMDDEELYVPNDVGRGKSHEVPKKSKLRYEKELEKFTSE